VLPTTLIYVNHFLIKSSDIIEDFKVETQTSGHLKFIERDKILNTHEL